MELELEAEALEEELIEAEEALAEAEVELAEAEEEEAAAEESLLINQVIEQIRADKKAIQKNLHLLPQGIKDRLTSMDFAVSCAKVFNAADADKNGYLTPDELFPILQRLLMASPRALTLENCARFADIFDSNKDGVISGSEFKSFCQFFSLIGYLEDQAFAEAEAAATAREATDNLAELEELEREGAWDDDSRRNSGDEDGDEALARARERDMETDVRQNDNVLNSFVGNQAMIEANLSRMPGAV